jgi:hypothetical protein
LFDGLPISELLSFRARASVKNNLLMVVQQKEHADVSRYGAQVDGW